MTFRIVDGDETEEFDVLEISDIAGLNTRDEALSLQPDEAQTMENAIMIGRGMEKRLGSATYGTAQTGDKVVGLGFLEQDSGITPLMMVKQTLFKYVSSAWAATDKADYTLDLDADIETFTSKDGAAATKSGTTTSGSTSYILEDTGGSFTKGAYVGFCVAIEGEVKYITDNSATLLFLGDKLNSDTDADYQSKAYAIHTLTPHAIIANGTDAVQKYDLTTTTAIDGTHVTSGKALPKYKRIASHQGRLWGALGIGDDNDRVFAGDTGVAENSTVDTNLNINLNFFNDGDAITDLETLPLSDSDAVLLVAKNNSVHVIEGKTVLEYSARPLMTGDGCIAPKSMGVGNNVAYMLGTNGVHSVTTQGDSTLDDPIPISRPIQDQIDAATAANKTNAVGAVFENRYWLQIGNDTWIYDLEASLRQNKHIWYKFNYPYKFNMLREIDGSLYGGDQTSGQAYTLQTGNQDGSDNINLTYQSGRFSLPGRPHVWIERVEFMMEKQTSTVLRFRYATDGGSLGSYTNQTLSANNARYAFNIQTRCYDLEFELVETGSNASSRIIFPIRIFYRRADAGADGTKG